MHIIDLFEYTQSSHNEPTFMNAMRDFLPIAIQHLNLKSLPKIKLERNLYNAEIKAFGHFSKEDKTITLDIENRHPVDIFRTLAHELTHYCQDTKNELSDNSGNDGSPAENDANATAGVIMRKFNQQHSNYLKLCPIALPK